MFFSAKGQKRAAAQVGAGLENYRRTAEGQIKSYGAEALSSLGQGSDAARRSLTSYGGAAYDDASRGFAEASTQLNIGRDQAQSRLDGVNGMYRPYADEGAGAVTSLGASLRGDNSSFKASDNYNFTLDEALRAATRQAAATGRLDGGGTLAALGDRAAGLASGEINNWQNRLQGLAGLGLQANDAIRSNTTNQANLDFQQGQGQANIAQQRGLGLAGINSGLGGAMAQSFTGQGAGEAGISANLGNSLAGLTNNTAMTQARNITDLGQATDAARAANVNMGLGLTGQFLGMGLGGGNTVGGSLFTGLGNMFRG
jgi:hypothetical protein